MPAPLPARQVAAILIAAREVPDARKLSFVESVAGRLFPLDAATDEDVDATIERVRTEMRL